MEVQRDVTSLCDVSKSTGQELHIKVGWIINKVVRGFSAATEKQERWIPALTAQFSFSMVPYLNAGSRLPRELGQMKPF